MRSLFFIVIAAGAVAAVETAHAGTRNETMAAVPIAGPTNRPTRRAERKLQFEPLEERRLLSLTQMVTTNGADDAPTVVASGAGMPMPRQMEYLNRGVVALRTGPSQAYVGWRLLGTDPADIAFNLYRSENGGAPVKLNSMPLTLTTDFVDSTAATGLNLGASNTYFVRPVIDGEEQAASESFLLAAAAPTQQYLSVPLERPAGGTVNGQNFTYSANDASVGDLNGDGDYEIILKWEPSNAQDNSNDGYTGNVLIDAYELDGTLLWRIDLGHNIRAGAHYTQFMVYDLDGDGKAEVAMRTAPGTKDGLGNNVLLGSDQADDDYRNGAGYIITGPEYLTVFSGETGAELATIPFEPARGSVSQWGDNYGNRVDRFLAGIAYLDGVRPSLVMTRGYYGPQSGSGQARNELAAYNFRDGELSQVWHFRAGYNINGNINRDYISQGAHSLTIGDVDGDGKDEIIYGAAAIDDDGTGLYSTGLGHGDALHLSDFDPSRPGLEVFMVHESPSSYGSAGGEFRDADSGELIFGIPASSDVGRGVAGDIWSGSAGAEMWASGGGATPALFSSSGNNIGRRPGSSNFLVWWDADPVRELLDGNHIDKYGPSADTRLLTATGASSNNGSKANPALSADLFGDWREEVIWRSNSSDELRIYTTTIPSTMRIYTLMHDPNYRMAIAWQNVAYNQPPHPGFFLGAGMAAPPTPQIYTVNSAQPPGDYNGDSHVDAADYTVWRDTFGSTTDLRADGDGDHAIGPGDHGVWNQNFGDEGGTLSAATLSDERSLGSSAPLLAAEMSPPFSEQNVSSQSSELEAAFGFLAQVDRLFVEAAKRTNKPMGVDNTTSAASSDDILDRSTLLVLTARDKERVSTETKTHLDDKLWPKETDRVGSIDAAFSQREFIAGLQPTKCRVTPDSR